MRVILSSLDTLLSKIPYPIVELISQFTYSSVNGEPVSTEFEANVSIDDIEELGFNYLHINGEYDKFIRITDARSEIEILIDELNYDWDGAKDWDNQVDDSIMGFGNFLDVAEKLKEYYKTKSKHKISFDDVAYRLSDFMEIDFDEYDIICLEGDYYSIYDELTE